MPDLDIRPERDGDRDAIRRLIEAAFATAARSSGIEGKIVDALRAAGALACSLVAVEGADIVGHVALSPVTVGEERGWYGLGPLSVRPDRQGHGIGRALVREGLDRLRGTGARGVVLVGEPDYYRRFGFVASPGLGYGEVPPVFVLALAFTDRAPAGNIAYHPAFDGA